MEERRRHGETAATDAVEDDNPNQDSIIGRVNTGEIKRRRRRSCNSCGKSLTCRSSLCRHHKTCKKTAFKAVQTSKPSLASPVVRAINRDKTIKLCLKWNGTSWETKSKKYLHYRMGIGRDLCNLLAKGAIKEGALNSTQNEYVQMYKSLFLD